jgi:hypothetical protein
MHAVLLILFDKQIFQRERIANFTSIPFTAVNKQINISFQYRLLYEANTCLALPNACWCAHFFYCYHNIRDSGLK